MAEKTELEKAWEKLDEVFPRPSWMPPTKEKIMTEEQKAAFIFSQTVLCLNETLGMMSENMQRQAVGNSMAYDSLAFAQVAEKYAIGHNDVIKFFHDQQSTVHYNPMIHQHTCPTCTEDYNCGCANSIHVLQCPKCRDKGYPP